MNLPQVAVRGFGTVRFQLECGEFLQVESVLFVPGLRISRLSVSTLEDGGLGTLVMFGRLFLYHMHDPECATVLIANRRERLYVLQGEIVHAGSRGW